MLGYFVLFGLLLILPLFDVSAATAADTQQPLCYGTDASPREKDGHTLSERDLRAEICGALKQTLARGRGIFHEDISAIATKHFSTTMTLSEVDGMLEAAKLSKLQKYNNFTQDPRNELLYVSKSVLSKSFSGSVSVLLDCYFRKSEGNLLLEEVKAFLDASTL